MTATFESGEKEMSNLRRKPARGLGSIWLLTSSLFALLLSLQNVEGASDAKGATSGHDSVGAVVPYQLRNLYSVVSSADKRYQYKPDYRKDALTAFLSPDEYEPVTFLLYHTRKCAKLDVSCSSLEKESAAPSSPDHLSLVVRYAWRLKHPQGFPFYLMQHPQDKMEKGSSTLVWLTVHAPKKTPPGNYVAKLRVRIDNKEALVLPLKVCVLPIALLEPDIPFGMYYDEDRNPPLYSSPGYQGKYFLDMKNHGMTSVTVYNHPLHEKDGKTRLDFDTSWRGSKLGLTKTMRLIADSELVGSGLPVMFLSTRQHKPRNGFGDIPTEFLLKIKEKQEKEKWPEFLFYLVDEPHDKRRQETLRAIWNDYYKVLPKGRIRTITAIEHRAIEPCGRFYDVWVFHAARGSIPKYRQMARQKGKDFYVYECDPGRYSLASIRCYTGLMTFKMGLQGNFQWAYIHHNTIFLRKDSDSPPDKVLTWAYILPSPSGPIPTVKWEARREGVDDYRYLLTLKALVEKLKKTGRKELAGEGENVLNEALKDVPQRYGAFRTHDGEYDQRRRMVAETIVKIQTSISKP